MQLAVLSNASFLGISPRLGLQMIAAELAEDRHQIDYFSCPVDPLGIFSPTKRARFLRAWRPRGQDRGVAVLPRLREFCLRAPFSRDGRYWKHRAQLRLFSSLAPSWIRKKTYDAVICDTAMTHLFRRHFRARTSILRLNANPDGFTHYVHPLVVEQLKDEIRRGDFDEIWAVSPALQRWAAQLNPATPCEVIPNGVRLRDYGLTDKTVHRQEKHAVYLGTFNEWFDGELLFHTAQNLPDWQIDLYGPGGSTWRRRAHPKNIRWCGALPFERVATTLINYSVGLIPFSGNGPLLQAIDPLKLYQYLAAGLEVVTTPIGSLETLPQGAVHVAATADEFIEAVRRAGHADHRTDAAERRRRSIAEVRDWSKTALHVEARLTRLLEQKAAAASA